MRSRSKLVLRRGVIKQPGKFGGDLAPCRRCRPYWAQKPPALARNERCGIFGGTLTQVHFTTQRMQEHERPPPRVSP
ncbi:hypothetical protein E2C01_003373 [Portunus trituberculatus]|uniref:Uncharacterized protein n=1 Tax=Portunus trituberculatus TaxID=210409 RepID=A0A5B7CM16_PORTR|nr:hypothetical protein [Portunus trituberculatus]